MIWSIFRRNATPPRPAPVYLVGAGPGDPELLTVKALRLLGTAQVVIHDRLVSTEIMSLIPSRAEKIYVGKACGDHVMDQREIEERIVAAAKRGKRVVRLKGGDPFTFGRGGEEMVALREAGLSVEVVPGITAAAGCAAQAGIPLTDRNYADSVTLVTAQRRAQAPETNWAQLASDPERTLVFYMGLGCTSQISHNLILHGLPENTPVAFIENGTTRNQREVFSTLGSMVADAEHNRLASPCLILVGRVTELAHKKVETAQAQKAASIRMDGRELPLPNLSQCRGHNEEAHSDYRCIQPAAQPFTGHRSRFRQ